VSKTFLRNSFIDVAGATANRRMLKEMRIREATELSPSAVRKRKLRAEQKKAALRQMLEAGEGRS